MGSEGYIKYTKIYYINQIKFIILPKKFLDMFEDGQVDHGSVFFQSPLRSPFWAKGAATACAFWALVVFMFCDFHFNMSKPNVCVGCIKNTNTSMLAITFYFVDTDVF